MNTPIDFEGYTPYYVQLKNELKSRIQMGEWRPGDQLPGEQELCQIYQVSRTVVRQALDVLDREHLIYRRKGKGTFVTVPKINASYAQKLSGFYHEMKIRGIEPVTHVLKRHIIDAPKKIADNLKLAVGTPIIEIERLRFLYDNPILFVTNYIPLSFCPALAEADLNNRSLYEFLENHTGMVIAFGSRSIEAVRANPVHSKLLEVNTGAPLLMLKSTSYLEDMTPVEYYFSYHRADRSCFQVEMIRVDS